MYKEVEDRRFPVFELMTLSPAERIKYLLGGCRLVTPALLEQLLPLARAWFTQFDGPEEPYQLYPLYFQGLAELVEQGEIEIDWSHPEGPRWARLLNTIRKRGCAMLRKFYVLFGRSETLTLDQETVTRNVKHFGRLVPSVVRAGDKIEAEDKAKAARAEGRILNER